MPLQNLKTTPRPHLLVSIHDVSPRTQPAVELLLDRLAARVPVTKVAMLVVPNHWGEAPILPGSPFATQLRDWAADGRDIFVHGWYHRDDSTHRSALHRVKAGFMTAREGEFLGLDACTSLSRMIDGKALVERIIERPAAGFIAPAWLYGEEARTALIRAGFALAEDHWRVWQPQCGTVLFRGPVITWASRSRARIASSLLAARALPQLLRSAPVIRVAVHPGDTHVPSLMNSIDRTLEYLARYRIISRYIDLASEAKA
ncbi:DUF2334 domain-containing protein [Sphingobium subterraneum]|uniref:Polysaccharide deacetylase n=1 Tax=Sphingobium subterraneum TaxID=627688 RepID=A0A841J7V0_9SPHN|nr:polysaccharide deacetylase family protein [Sphingobium subterraneum]MBB6124628.1 hypothetical protein [Sphingobium subterraneum]